MKNFQIYLTYIFGTILFLMGLFFATFYFSFSYIAPLLQDLFSLNINLSISLLLISLFFIFSGSFLGIYSISKINSGKSKFWISLSSIFSLLSFLFQLYKLATLGPTWIGLEFFGLSGNRIEAMYISALIFLINFFTLVISFSIFWIEMKGEE
ncbi:MAG: hypothetical protein PWP54_1602 [Thermosipho sp. (in: thermotogales)]|nr:hypothetical protein [Thermosipho sp. (in: thermotogales)]MDN5325169.1 hypothetical protein [Thermosipho sp. (in: thermotogales)]